MANARVENPFVCNNQQAPFWVPFQFRDDNQQNDKFTHLEWKEAEIHLVWGQAINVIRKIIQLQ